jgi:hypothetical protein
MLRDRYPKVKIPSISNASSLASILSISEDDLNYFTEHIDEYYKSGKLLKRRVVTQGLHMTRSQHSNRCMKELKTEYLKTRLPLLHAWRYF